MTLHLIRLLKNNGCTIFLAESLSFSISSVSNCVSKAYRVASPRFHSNAFIRQIKAIVKFNTIDIIIPTCEEVFYFSKYISQFEGLCDVFTMPLSVMDMLHNKYRFNKYIDKLNLDHVHQPYSERIHKSKDHTLESSIEYFKRNTNSRGVICKPEYSRFGQGNDDSPLILQSFVEGNEYCLFAICQDGQVVSFTAYPSNLKSQSVTIAFEHYESELLLNLTKEITDNLHYTGFISFDVIVRSDGRVSFIECNPRLTSGIFLFNPININFDSKTNGVIHKPDATTKVSLKLILFTSFYQKPLAKLKTFFTTKDIIYSNNDMRPFFYQLFSYSYMVYKSIKAKMPLSKFSTNDIEFNGTKQI